MFPTFRQRWIILFSIIIGAIIWSQIAGILNAGDALGGALIFQAPTNIFLAIVLIILAGIPAIALGIFTSAVGNRLSGLFVIAISLSALAGSTSGEQGGGQGFIFSSSLPDGYLLLIGEIFIWLIGLLLVLWLLQNICPKIETKIPEIIKAKHSGDGLELTKINSQAIFSFLISGAIGGFLTNLLMRADGSGQTIGALIIAFAISGFIVKTFISRRAIVSIIVSPCIVAITSYAFVLVRFENSRQVLASYYAHTLPGAALVLPIFYVSAGVAGATVGIGLAQAIEQTKEKE